MLGLERLPSRNRTDIRAIRCWITNWKPTTPRSRLGPKPRPAETEACPLKETAVAASLDHWDSIVHDNSTNIGDVQTLGSRPEIKIGESSSVGEIKLISPYQVRAVWSQVQCKPFCSVLKHDGVCLRKLSTACVMGVPHRIAASIAAKEALSRRALGSHLGGSGFDLQFCHPDLGFTWFPEITPNECWNGCLPHVVADCFLVLASRNTGPHRTRFDSRRGRYLIFHMGIVQDDATGLRVFSGSFRFPRSYIPALFHAHLASPSSALQTPMLRADRTSPLHCALLLMTSLSKSQPLAPQTSSAPTDCPTEDRWLQKEFHPFAERASHVELIQGYSSLAPWVMYVPTLVVRNEREISPGQADSSRQRIFPTDTLSVRFVMPVLCHPLRDANWVRFPAGSHGFLHVLSFGSRFSLGHLQLPPSLHSCAAPYSPHFKLIGSQGLDVMSCPNLVHRLHEVVTFAEHEGPHIEHEGTFMEHEGSVVEEWSVAVLIAVRVEEGRCGSLVIAAPAIEPRDLLHVSRRSPDSKSISKATGVKVTLSNMLAKMADRTKMMDGQS
ncbi:hypothetical protein PR048_026444 [Dryococelus australis]|uniref:Uncharacterized protein n=1 Tax=Dryococelus australis TaxID=614101 RepID=A0ABQ9GLE6_9NEOP|nr:hypothetical protein PR048_026444 [Dryococelus australis]